MLLLTIVAIAGLLAQDANRTGLDEMDIRNWTPDTQATWGNPEWRRFGDAKIRDDRYTETDYGPIYGATIRLCASNGKELQRAHKGLGIRLGGTGDTPRAMLVYDRNLIQCQGGWIGDWLEHSDERFGLLDVPRNPDSLVFVCLDEQAFLRPGEEEADRESWCFPLPEEVGRFQAVHLHGNDVVLEFDVSGTRVLEHPTLEQHEGEWKLTRYLEIAPDDQPLHLRVAHLDGGAFAAVGGDAQLIFDDHHWYIAIIPPSDTPRYVKIVHDADPDEDAGSPRPLAHLLSGDRPLRWPETVQTTIEDVGEAGPYVHERIVPPFDNPWKSLMFLSGLDFLSDGSPIVSTLFGDVWTVSGIDAGTPIWKRFATGLYQPLGIKVVDGEIFVIERGQITQLIDHDSDGEADEYRNINNRWHTPGDGHCYDINLETDPAGNWYFLKNGAWHTPTGGCLLKVAADGSGDAEVYATGFRHCNSLGISPEGQLASGGQQGTWQPATRLDLNEEGGFYGLMDAAHDDTIEFYSRPLLWMPLECDNSAGDPVWAPDHWGPLGGELLHLSWGQCWLLHILQDNVDGMQQGTAVVLPLGRTMAGPSRGRFSPVDGDLWIAGSMGWQTWGPWDGSLDRIRYTGDSTPLPTPSSFATVPGGLMVSFPTPLDPDSALNLDNWNLKQWNYHWSSGYGSAHWSVRGHEIHGEDQVDIAWASLSDDDHSVYLKIPDLRPAMQTKLGWTLTAKDGAAIDGVSWGTTHRIAKPPPEDLMNNEGILLSNGVLTLEWDGPVDDTEVLVRAVQREDGHYEGTGVDLHVEEAGPHLLRITLHDRHIVAELDGEEIFSHFETDTRIPLAGTLDIQGAPPSRFQVNYLPSQTDPSRN